jgi:hypothetical protein
MPVGKSDGCQPSPAGTPQTHLPQVVYPVVYPWEALYGPAHVVGGDRFLDQGTITVLRHLAFRCLPLHRKPQIGPGW